MPANPNRDVLLCRVAIVRVLDGVIAKGSVVNYDNLVFEIVTHHPVSELMVERFVERFYVKMGKLQLKDGELHVV